MRSHPTRRLRSVRAEGSAGDRNLLGGKGANLAEMCSLGLPVSGFFRSFLEFHSLQLHHLQARHLVSLGPTWPGPSRGPPALTQDTAGEVM